ncbi:hypothetical protein FHW96_002329 [Novosphingobium sp. SG751A]|uniref:phage major capsid protein, P2 family n=1 Tax=Novosphingobium sp. SG751A TaxID=2587000 RepID=UPI0015516F25|nr:phage major capsid protein, P2 family [Novosphingobium sp. SG751A]NOW46171.1 hypothetical protein [Novosphingobium sp. SG751A]
MRNETRALFMAYASQIALLNGVPDATAQFAVAPSVEQKLEDKIKESSEFLNSINIIPVIDQEGQVLAISTARTIAGRTDTSGGTRRNPTDPNDSSEKRRYLCKKTDFDWAQSYALMDAWRHKPEFQTLMRDAILKQQGRDRIMIGWNGTSAAAQTDRAANPMLQDVNIGWIKKLRDNASAQIMSDGNLTVKSNGANNAALNAIYVKAGVDLFDPSLENATSADADYSSLDALVLDAKRLIPEWWRGDTSLVVIVGHDLVDDKYFNIAQATGAEAMQVEATDRILRSTKQIGGLPAVRVPFFPANAIMITRLDNLSIYVQEGTRRRQLKDEPEYNRIANYESVNEAYVIEEYEMVAYVENIVVGAAPARPAP